MRYSGQVYKQACDLCLYIEQVVQGFARYQKYSLGTDLRDTARRVLKLVVRANVRRDRRGVLLEIREESMNEVGPAVPAARLSRTGRQSRPYGLAQISCDPAIREDRLSLEAGESLIGGPLIPSIPRRAGASPQTACAQPAA